LLIHAAAIPDHRLDAERFYYSYDGGGTWNYTEYDTTTSVTAPFRTAMAANGSILMSVSSNGPAYMSYNQGLNWTKLTTPGLDGGFADLTMSTDGRYIFMCGLFIDNSKVSSDCIGHACTITHNQLMDGARVHRYHYRTSIPANEQVVTLVPTILLSTAGGDIHPYSLYILRHADVQAIRPYTHTHTPDDARAHANTHAHKSTNTHIPCPDMIHFAPCAGQQRLWLELGDRCLQRQVLSHVR
jgi:hypothetical protein